MRKFLPLLFVFTLLRVVTAEETDEPKMTKIVAKVIDITATGEKEGPAKLLYRAGTKYARVEEQAGGAEGAASVIITNEPDSWVVNLEEKRARYVVDEGPDFATKLPIFWRIDGKPESEFEALEFGNELEFFRPGRARDVGMRKIEGRSCKALSLKSGDHEVILYLEPKRNRPFQINLIKYGRLVTAVRYMSYETDLPFDKSLFTPPANVTIEQS